MDLANNAVEVRISRRVLWVGSEAYPLQNIARAQAVRVTPRSRWTGRNRAVGGCLGFLALWLIVGLAAAAHSPAVGLLVAALVVIAISLPIFGKADPAPPPIIGLRTTIGSGGESSERPCQ